jgi:hypothetical protein
MKPRHISAVKVASTINVEIMTVRVHDANDDESLNHPPSFVKDVVILPAVSGPYDVLLRMTNREYECHHETTLDRVRERSFRREPACSLRDMLATYLTLSGVEYCNEDLKNASGSKLCSPAAQRRIRCVRATRGWRTRRGRRWLPRWGRGWLPRWRDGDESRRGDVEDGSRRRIQRDESEPDDRNPRIWRRA